MINNSFNVVCHFLGSVIFFIPNISYICIMETRNSTKISTDKLDVFVKRLKKIGIDVKLSGNFPWIYLDEIYGMRVKETFQANHGFTIMFLPPRKDSPVSNFTDIKEIFNLIRKYKSKYLLEKAMEKGQNG